MTDLDTVIPLRCERPTNSGKPCQQILDLTQVACRLHSTEHDAALAARWQKAFRDGFAAGQQSARGEYEAAARDAARAARFRLTERGKQIVRCGKYAYVWDGDEPLAVGDQVLLPGNWLFRDPSEGTVTAFGTDYDGELARVIRKLDVP